MNIPPGYTAIAPGLFRGPRPTVLVVKAFDPSLKTIIDLEPTGEEFVPNEYHIPMSQRLLAPPKLVDVQKAAAIMADVKQRPCLVHCHSGVDRSGTVCAYFRVRYQGWEPDKAFREMIDMHMHAWYRVTWRWAIKKMLAEAEKSR